LDNNFENVEWIVKSSSQILGPFTTDQVIDLIKKKGITPIDEITPEFGYWSYVRDISVFQPALNQQTKNGSIEVTKTQNVTSTFTDDMTSTELLDDTEELSHVGSVDKTNPNPKVQPLRSSQLPKPVNTLAKPKQKAPSRSYTGLLFSLLVLAALAGGLFHYQDLIFEYYNQYNKTDLVSKSKKVFYSGDYRSAYALFQEINQNPNLKNEIKGFNVQFATLVLNQERQTVYARELLEKSEPQIKNSPEWSNTMGLSYLIDQNYSESLKYFNQSLDMNPDFLPAWVNLGYLYFSQNKFQESWDYFYSAYLRGHTEGHIVVYMALSLIEQWKVNKDDSFLKRSYDLVENYLSTSADKRYLNQILYLWLVFKLKNKTDKEIEKIVSDFIDSDPYAALLFKTNIYEYGLENKRFENFCAESSRELGSQTLNARLYRSLCYFKLGFSGGATQEPLSVLEEKYAKDPQFLAVKSVIFDNADETYQKSLLIGRALSANTDSKYLLPLILQARFCEQKGDLVCAAKYWNFVYEKNKLEIGIYAGLGKYFLSKKEKNKADVWAEDGRILSSSYRPLIELNY
jgi:hypothetical protein